MQIVVSRALMALLFLATAASEAGAAPVPKAVIVVDLDRTVMDPTPRIAAIERDVGTPGPRAYYSDPTKPHGSRFLLDPRYLAFDTVVPGAPDAIAQVQKALNADILYLSGRFREPMWQATVEQLRKNDFPGYGRRSHLRAHVSLQLRERSDLRSVTDYKLARLARIAPPWRVAAIFEDSGKNLQAFWAAGYRRESGVELIRMTGLAPLAAAQPEPAWLCLNGFSDLRDLAKLEGWLKSASRCEQLLMDDLFRGED